MEQVQNRCNHNALQYIQQTENNSARMTGLHNSTYNPLGKHKQKHILQLYKNFHHQSKGIFCTVTGKPEVTINLNEVFISWAFQPMLDELGENVIGDSDNDSLTQDSSTDSEVS